MKDHLITLAIVVVGVILAQYVSTKVLKLNNFEDEYEKITE